MARSQIVEQLARMVGQTLGRELGRLGDAAHPRRTRGGTNAPRPPRARRGEERPGTSHMPTATGGRAAYPGDFEGVPTLSYAPYPDDVADPGEIVWTWVPFEEDASRGKDRPVLVIGRDEPWLLVLMLTSKDHDRDAAQEARAGRTWVDIGTGAWDGKGRPSEVRVDRVIRVDQTAVRRQGAALDKMRFDQVASAVRSAAR